MLIIEDDFALRLLADLLSEAGYRVATMPNGATAIDDLRRAPALPQLILLDLMMPIMNGWHFRTLQSADPALAAIPTVVLSAHLDLGRPGITMTADDYLAKPLDGPGAD